MISLWLFSGLLAILPFVSQTEWVMFGIWGALGIHLVERYRAGILRRWAFPAAVIPLILLVLAGVLQALAGGANAGTWPVLKLWGTAVALLVMGAGAISSVRAAGTVLTGAAVGAAFTGVHGVWQSVVGVANEARWTDVTMRSLTRVFSVFGNPNIFGTYLALILPALVLLVYVDRRWWRGALVLPIATALVLTYSRGAWVAFALRLLLVLIYLSRRWLLVAAGGALVAPFALPRQIWGRLASISLADSSIAYRLRIFTGSWRVIQTHFLLGVGPGLISFREAYDRYQVANTPAFHAHNVFLQVWAERGLLGLVLLLAALALIAISAVRSRAPRPERILAIAALGAIAGALLQGMVDYIWMDFRVAILFWAITGVGVGLCRAEIPLEPGMSRGSLHWTSDQPGANSNPSTTSLRTVRGRSTNEHWTTLEDIGRSWSLTGS